MLKLRFGANPHIMITHTAVTGTERQKLCRLHRLERYVILHIRKILQNGYNDNMGNNWKAIHKS